MRIKIWAVVVVGCCAITFVGHGSSESGAAKKTRSRVSRVVGRDIDADLRFVRDHFRESLEPLLEGFRKEFSQRETGLMITTQVDEYGTVVARVRIMFQPEIPALTLAETYTPNKIDRLRSLYFS